MTYEVAVVQSLYLQAACYGPSLQNSLVDRLKTVDIVIFVCVASNMQDALQLNFACGIEDCSACRRSRC